MKVTRRNWRGFKLAHSSGQCDFSCRNFKEPSPSCLHLVGGACQLFESAQQRYPHVVVVVLAIYSVVVRLMDKAGPPPLLHTSAENSSGSGMWHVCTYQHRNIATLQHCNIATLRHCNIATLQHCDIATLQHCTGFQSRYP